MANTVSIVLEYNNENIRFIRLLLANQIAYIFRSNNDKWYYQTHLDFLVFKQLFISPGMLTIVIFYIIEKFHSKLAKQLLLDNI